MNSHFHAFLRFWKTFLSTLVLLLVSLGGAQADDPTIHREGWSFDRSQLDWYDNIDPAKQKAAGTINDVAGWTEYDFEIPKTGWYALWETKNVPGWNRDIYLDQKVLFWLTTTPNEEADQKTGWFKEGNLFLAQGKHTLRFRRLEFPGCLPGEWELRPANGDPAASIRVTKPGLNVIRAGTKVRVTVTGGMPSAPTTYQLLVRNESTHDLTPTSEITFPATREAIDKTVEISFPQQGAFALVAKVKDKLLTTSDLKAGQYVAVDTKNPPSPAAELKTTNVVDIDCTADRTLGKDYWEKDGPTRVVDAPFGRYRESLGLGSSDYWSTAGYSYSCKIPDTNAIYRLRVDYPDDDRRSMGFWINDGDPKVTNICTGGVETGDHYPLTHKMITYESYFYPQQTDLIVAVINLVPGLKAAAARIRIDRVDSGLPAAPLGQTNGRSMGFYMEESPRWIKFFGGRSDDDPLQNLLTLDRWGQWNRYIGANLMYPTVNVYQNNEYPSRILDGYFSTTLNYVRLIALMAEKYDQKFVPEFHLTGQRWFDQRVMGVWVKKTKDAKGNDVDNIKFASPEAEACVIRNCDGDYHGNSEAFMYNVLNPRVQDMYISVFGEVADTLGDTESFAGISSRLMLDWQWQGWNAIEGLRWGYDDWTTQEYEKETGIKVPGEPNDPARFHQRFVFLTSALQREKWLDWRCRKVFAFHQRLRDRIQKAKPSAKLFFTWSYSPNTHPFADDMIGQMRECGIDMRLYAKEPGIVMIPNVLYGRRYSTPLSDALAVEPLYDPSVKAVARSGDRGFALYSNYYEVCDNLDWSKFGGKPYQAFDACIPSSVNEREMYAIALADSDTSFFTNGGNGWIFGTPEIMQPFLREYRALPAVPFDMVEKVRDPVALWQHKDEDGDRWFYAVNRLNVPVTITLQVGADAKVLSAVDNSEVPLDGGKLTFTLNPFMLRSFRGTGITLGACQVETPSDYADQIKPLVAFAKGLRDDLAARRIVPELTETDQNAALHALDESIDGFARSEYWKARNGLQQAALVRVYYASGTYPPDLFERSVPLGIPQASDPPAEKTVIGDNRGRLDTILDLTYDQDEKLWTTSGSQLIQLDADGHYTHTLPLFAPYEFNTGDPRWGMIDTPNLLWMTTVRALPGGSLVLQKGGDAPVVYNAQGNAIKLALGFQLSTPAEGVHLLTTDTQGNIYAANANGLYEFAPDGTIDRKLSDLVAQAAAVDAKGRIYLAHPNGVAILDAKGSQLASLPDKGFERLAVNADGKTLLVSQGNKLVCYQNKNGQWTKAWDQTLEKTINALAISPKGKIAVGFRNEGAGNVIAREYTLGPTSLTPKQDLVSNMADVSNETLSGPTKLKIYNNQLYFASYGKIMRLTPGNPDKVEVAFDPQFGNDSSAFEAFDVAPNGDLYLSSTRHAAVMGANLYLCRKTATGWSQPEYLNNGKPVGPGWILRESDIAVDGSGKVLLRVLDPKSPHPENNLSIFRWSPDGTCEKVFDLGDTGGIPQFGFHLNPDGGLLVAYDGQQGIASFSPQQQVVWKDNRQLICSPGYFDLRQPDGITADSRGNIWVTDPSRNQILHLDSKGTLLAGYGRFGTVDDRDGLSFNGPTGIATLKDSSGAEWLYIADTNNMRLVKWRLP